MRLRERSIRDPALRSHWARVSGFPMHARVSPRPAGAEYPPIVLVHGQVVSSRYMEPLAARLSRVTDVYVPDLPGFGLSASPRETPGAEGLADFLAAWMAEMGLDSAAVVGNSFGCQIAAELAADQPARVRALVLQGPTIDRRARKPLPQIVRWLKTGRYERQSLSGVLIRDYLSAGARRSAKTFAEVLRHEIEQVLPRVRAPTLIVRGSRDAIVPADWAEEVAALVPDGRLITVPGAAHTLNYSAPLEFARVILGFLRRTEAAVWHTAAHG